MGGPCPPLPAVGARAVSSARLVWCVSSCRAAFAFLFFSVASPCCLRAAHALAAARPAPAALGPSPPRRALRLRQLLLLHRALGQSARLPLLSSNIERGVNPRDNPNPHRGLNNMTESPWRETLQCCWACGSRLARNLAECESCGAFNGSTDYRPWPPCDLPPLSILTHPKHPNYPITRCRDSG